MKHQKELYQQLEASEEQFDTKGATSEQVCPHCHTKNEAEAMFCEECGTPLGNSRICPQCGHTLDLLADYCEYCNSYVSTNRCSFCGADIAETDSFCPECGFSREGIICPTCHTRSFFSYCPICSIPLTEEAMRESQRIHTEPMWQQMDKLLDELDSWMKMIPADTPHQAEQCWQNEELRRRVRDLLGTPTDEKHDMTLRLGETSETIANRIAIKRRELQQMLDATAARPGENPVHTRNFVMARKPASALVGWKCNFKQAIHPSPCACACPQLGGKWVVIDNNEKGMIGVESESENQ